MEGRLSLSGDGNTLAVAHTLDDSSATGINGDESDNGAMDSGAVRVFIRDSDSWNQQSYIKASNTEPGDQFGYCTALSSDGNTLAVGAPGEDSSATGIDGDQIDNFLSGSGAVYLFTRSDNQWSQQAYIKASNPVEGDHFGLALSLSSTGNVLAVSAAGINGNQTDNFNFRSGAVYLFEYQTDTWTQTAYIKASNPGCPDSFGSSLALSHAGNILAVGSPHEASAASGINGDQSDNSAPDAGAAHLFSRDDGLWNQNLTLRLRIPLVAGLITAPTIDFHQLV